jgi:hypothetical protein
VAGSKMRQSVAGIAFDDRLVLMTYHKHAASVVNKLTQFSKGYLNGCRTFIKILSLYSFTKKPCV